MCPVARHSTPISTSRKRDWGFTHFHPHLHPGKFYFIHLERSGRLAHVHLRLQPDKFNLTHPIWCPTITHITDRVL